MNTPRHDGMDTSDNAIEDGINNAMQSLDEEEANAAENNDESKENNGDEATVNNDKAKEDEAPTEDGDHIEVPEVVQEDEEYSKVLNEYTVQRPMIHLWRYIQALQNEIDCKSFYDIEIFCRDGVVSWNRLLLALSHPEFAFLIYPDEREEVMVHLPDTAGSDLLKVLQSALEDPPIGVEAIDPDAEVKYTLVQHTWPKDYDQPLVGWDESDGEEIDEADEDDVEWVEGGPAPKLEAKLEPVEVFCQTCEVCDKEFYVAEQLQDHAKVHNPGLIKFTCGISQCAQGFILENMYQNHVKLHEKELKDAEIEQKALELMEKVEDEEGPTMWRCTTCDFTNRIRYTVKTHCETHLVTIQSCGLCDTTCSTRNALRTHMYRKHPEAMNRSRSGIHPGKNKKKADDEDYSSDDDDYEPLEFSEKAKDWEPPTQKRRPYEKACPTCQSEFTTKAEYEDHAKVHNSDLVKFTCTQCLEGFIIETEYKKHVTKHSVARTKALGPAGIEQELVNMVTTVFDQEMNKMMYQCTYCGYKSIRRVAVMEHAETHDSTIAHECPVCKKTCPTKNALRAHLTRQHPTAKWLSMTHTRGGGGNKRRRTNDHDIHYNNPNTPQAITYNNSPNYNNSPSPGPYQAVKMHPCPHCHKSSPTKNALRVHVARYHKEIDQAIKKEYFEKNPPPQNQSPHQSSASAAQKEAMKQKAIAAAFSDLTVPAPRTPAAPKASKSQPGSQQFTQLRPPAAHTGHSQPTQQQLASITPQQALALQAQQNAFPDFFWNKY